RGVLVAAVGRDLFDRGERVRHQTRTVEADFFPVAVRIRDATVADPQGRTLRVTASPGVLDAQRRFRSRNHLFDGRPVRLDGRGLHTARPVRPPAGTRGTIVGPGRGSATPFLGAFAFLPVLVFLSLRLQATDVFTGRAELVLDARLLVLPVLDPVGLLFPCLASCLCRRLRVLLGLLGGGTLLFGLAQRFTGCGLLVGLDGLGLLHVFQRVDPAARQGLQ